MAEKFATMKYLEDIMKKHAGDPKKSEDLWIKYMTAIKNAGKVNEILINFRPDQDSMHMLTYLWHQEEFHSIYKFEEIRTKLKNNNLAEIFISDGVVAYNKKMYHTALKNLNVGILLAPHGETPERKLAIGYAARSAVLYEMQQYEKCIADSKRAIKNRYPGDFNPLIDREMQCEKKLVQFCPAKKQSRRGARASKAAAIRAPAPDLVYPCCMRELIEPTQVDNTNVGARYRNLFNSNHFKCADLIEANPKVPPLTSAANIGYTEEKGHHIYATRDILPGEVVIKEFPFSYSLLPGGRFSNCDYCGIPMIAPIPCPSCITVAFCSEKCLDIAQELYHKAECYLLPTILEIDHNGKTILFLRSMFKEKWSSLKEKYSSFKKEQNTKKPEEMGYDESGIFNTDSFNTFFHVFNKNRVMKRPFYVLRRCCMALTMLKCIAFEGNYIGKVYKEMPEELTEDLLILADILIMVNLKVYCILPFYQQNFLLSDIKLEQKKYAIGICNLSAMLRHSCIPSLLPFNYGRCAVFRAVTFIPEGNELTVSYSPNFIRENLHGRTAYLKDIGMECHCFACTEDWSIPGPGVLFDLNCPHCKGVLDPDRGCLKCKKERFTLPASISGNVVDNDVNVRSLYTFVKKTMNASVSNPRIIRTTEELKALHSNIAVCGTFAKPSYRLLQLLESFEVIYVMKSYHTHYLEDRSEISGCCIQ